SVTLPEEDQELIKQTQRGAALSNPALAGGVMAGAAANAMENAAKNEGGAMNGFVGMGMAMNASGGAINGLFQHAAAQGQQGMPQQAAPAPAPAPAAPTAEQAAGAVQADAAAPSAGPKFCSQCGKPVTPGAKFCAECGSPLQ
ncbi:MAG: zinc-ribbon domain-containing protein, partial [Lachnospiraceae bacterium]|nr:zinc-ribbon domain-containing protein [Lachnospiraceae bacterium]